MASEVLLLVDPPQSGRRNMSTDEALLELAEQRGRPVFRLYRWNEPTLSLGYFQSYQDRTTHRASLEIAAVRRRSGGGAIVHDRELTYSFALPSGHPFARNHRLTLYETIHRVLIGVLKDKGIDAFLVADRKKLFGPDEKNFLCFRRFADGDIAALPKGDSMRRPPDPIKLVGSAQYRNKAGAVLQHGSLLLDRSVAAPELSGVGQLFKEQTAESPTPDQWGEDILEALQHELRCTFCRIFSPSCNREKGGDFEQRIAFFMEKRYSEMSWLLKR